MSNLHQPSQRPLVRYRIRFGGHLAEHWSAFFDGMTLTANADGTSWLDGSVRDQAALYGMLSRLRDLGLTLLDVHRIVLDEGGETGQSPR